MIIVMKQNSTNSDIENITAKLKENGLSVHISEGVSQTIIGVIGDKSTINPNDFEVLSGVKEVVIVTESHKLSNRVFHPENTVIDVVLKDKTLIFLVFAIFEKKLKYLSSLFRIRNPFLVIFSIISDLAFAIPFKLLKFSMCASPILVITPICGLTKLERFRISPGLFIPISKTPYWWSFSKLHKLKGTPNWLL